jgi:serine/threonine-protein kinase
VNDVADGPGRATAGTLVADRYELIAPIGIGGMAQVWSADDRLLGRRVAVKILHPHLASDPSFVQRFRREAVAAARLVHPNIVAVYDTVSDGSTEAIVMELVEGTTLRERLDRTGPIDERRVRELGRQIASALDCAHRNGIVHRDLKPANILITPDGSVRLADFGIAKAEEDPDLTVAGTLVGTAAYLAPEQVGDGRVDQRTDLYALSTVLYEAASGTTPFRGDSPAATALARLHQEPADLATVAPALSTAFCAAIMRNLQRAPERRFQSALDFGAALAAPRRATSAPRRHNDGLDHTDEGVATVTGTSTVTAAPRKTAVVTPPRRSVTGRLALALLVLGPAIIIAGLLIDGAGTGSDDARRPTTTVPATVAAAQAFDPYTKDGAEHDDQAQNVLDDDPTTSWSTEHYNSQTFGTKPGVGLVLRLGGRSRVESLRIAGTTGWKGEAYVLADDPKTAADPKAAVPTHGGVPIDASSGTTHVALGGRIGTYVLIWVTDLGPGHQVRLSQVGVSGRASSGG